MKFDLSFYNKISRIVQVRTDNFDRIVHLSGLDPKIDFIKLDLAGIDFSGADLRGFNFSGSDLTDCNFNGAKITGAVFSFEHLDWDALKGAADFDEYLRARHNGVLSPKGDEENDQNQINEILSWRFVPPAADDESRWTIVSTAPGREIVATEALYKKQIKCYCPLQKTSRQNNIPFFTRHIFVETNLSEKSLGNIMRAKYIDCIAYIDHHPAYVPNIFVDALRKSERDGSIPNTISILFDEGEQNFNAIELAPLVEYMITLEPEIRVAFLRSLLRHPADTHARADVFEFD